MSEFGGLWKHENNQPALVAPKMACGCPSGVGIKNGQICYPSYGRTQKKTPKKDIVALNNSIAYQWYIRKFLQCSIRWTEPSPGGHLLLITEQTVYREIGYSWMLPWFCSHSLMGAPSPWYDLRGWLGVKQQLSIYLMGTQMKQSTQSLQLQDVYISLPFGLCRAKLQHLGPWLWIRWTPTL